MTQTIITILSIAISLTTLLTFIRNEIHKQRDYGKFLKEIDITSDEVKELKNEVSQLTTEFKKNQVTTAHIRHVKARIKEIDSRYNNKIVEIEGKLGCNANQIHSLDKLTNELFVRLDSISSSIEELKNMIRK